MALIRGFAKVDDKGRIPIPTHIAREAGFKPGQLVEIKVNGPQGAPFVTIHKRKQAR